LVAKICECGWASVDGWKARSFNFVLDVLYAAPNSPPPQTFNSTP